MTSGTRALTLLVIGLTMTVSPMLSAITGSDSESSGSGSSAGTSGPGSDAFSSGGSSGAGSSGVSTSGSGSSDSGSSGSGVSSPRGSGGGEPMFRGDLRHAGVYDDPGVAELHGVKWKLKTGGAVYSSPAVADGVVFVGSNDGRLYAVDADTGSLKWRFAAKARIASSPAVSGQLVYVESYDSHLYAVDAATGQMKWSFATEGEKRFTAPHIHGMLPEAQAMPDPFDFFLSSPAVWNGAVYFGSGDGHVYALDAATGALKWKFRTGDVVHASPAIADGTLFIGSWDTYIYALDAATGTERWRFKTGDDPKIHNHVGIQSSPVVSDGLVYVGCRDANLYALDARSGAKVWAIDNKGSWVIGSPAVSQGMVYFTTSDGGMFHAADARTGAEAFALRFEWPMFSSPAVAGPFVYVGSHAGKLLAINTATHAVAWTFQTEASRQLLPGLSNEKGEPNYAAAMASMFYDDVVAGVQKMFSVGAILSSPVVVNRTIYVGSADGYLYALN
jgi:outer membrane protein assembly factor BamB